MTATDTVTPSGAESDSAPVRRVRGWEPWALAVLLIGTGVTYIWGLGASGWANSFYSAAVQAGSVSWKAFFFGSSDAANAITVDKPPMSLWLMSLSVRIFGLSYWSVLVPQALLGVGSVALLWATLRRQFGSAAGLLAGLTLAVTPVAALMFRFNNPDALLVLLMIAAVWATMRAVENGRTRWLVLTGVFVGFGFLTKQLQVMLVVPPLAFTYLIAGPPQFGKRFAQLFAALAAMIVSAGWWLLIVELWPASSRPWIGGSQNNSILELTMGYNGFGRLNGSETGSVGGGGRAGGRSMWGQTGIGRMFDSEQGGQIAWLIPTAVILLVVGLVLRGRAHRSDPARAALIVWGLWLAVTGITFSFMAGIFHPYYTVALAPAIAALVGTGSTLLWRARDRYWVRIAIVAALAAAVVMSWDLLGRSAAFVPWLRVTVLIVGVIGAAALVVPFLTRGRVGVVTVLAALFVGLAGPTAYAVDTIDTPHGGAIVTAGPSTGGFGGGRRPSRLPNQFLGQFPGQAPGRQGAGGLGGPGGNLLQGSRPTEAVVKLLEQNASSYTWVAAATGSNSASGYQLATQDPVMAVGGFNGTDPSPTLAQFQQYVADGKIHYFVGGGTGFGGMGSAGGTASRISTWVTANYRPVTVDGIMLYDLTAR